MATQGSQTHEKPYASKSNSAAAVAKSENDLKKLLQIGVEQAAEYINLQNVSKASLTRIEITELPSWKPDFELPGASKDLMIADWLKYWIGESLKKGTLDESYILPRKADIAAYLKVSVGTVQNAIRYIEDEGYVESKQRIGTIVRNPDKKDANKMRKQTSKRDQAVLAIQHYIIKRKIQPGDLLPSARVISEEIHSAPNTTRLALEYLTSIGTLKSLGNRGNKANWSLIKLPDIDASSTAVDVVSETLIDQLERDLKHLIAEYYGVNEKLPSHLDLSVHFKTSIKTVHDAMQRLAQQGIIRSKRGRYGSFVLRKPDANKLISLTDTMFVPADQARFYNYERVEESLKSMIIAQYAQVGAKLPPMAVLAEKLEASSNTIRRALQNLGAKNIVRFTRGRYGGTYVLTVPVAQEEPSQSIIDYTSETSNTFSGVSGA
ncbi:MAG: GntR family transcriptional regulator [Cyanobacteria bacterium P01_H01_bin.74]